MIGVAGGKEKCDLIVKEFGFDAAIDYKVSSSLFASFPLLSCLTDSKEYDTKDKLGAKLAEVAGEPITAYYDNTGGKSLQFFCLDLNTIFYQELLLMPCLTKLHALEE